MPSTFKPDDCMVITIPLVGNLRNVGEDQLMPEKLTCVFFSEVFLRGRPKELGAAQFSMGVFVICVGVLITLQYGSLHLIYTLPNVLFIAGGILTYAAGCSPMMPVVKLSLIFNILSLFWAIIALVLCLLLHDEEYTGYIYNNNNNKYSKYNIYIGLKVVMCVLLGLELILALVLLFWGIKAVCRSHFNTLPLNAMKQDG